MNYTLTRNSITVIEKTDTLGSKPHVVNREAPNFTPLRDALLAEDWDKARANLTVQRSIRDWAKRRFSVDAQDRLCCDGQPMPQQLQDRARKLAAEQSDPSPILRFWERLKLNPSWRSVQHLWPFLDHVGIPLTEDGCFLAYKGVNDDYTDRHTSTIDNSPGTKHSMDRNLVSDDPDTACHFGFHVGAESYARSFGARMLVCRVDPADVVCVPRDESHRKMRVCAYEVVGNWTGTMPSDVISPAVSEAMSYIKNRDIDFEDADMQSDNEEEQPEVVVHSVGVKVPRKYRRFAAMSAPQLLDLPIAKLREFATYGLRMVGASKVPGGKAALVARIMDCIPKERI